MMDFAIEVNDDGVKVKPELMENEKFYHCIFKDKVILVFKDHQEFLNCFEFKISKHSMVIGKPIAFNENYANLYYSTEHTLTMNEDGSYRYTKLLTPKQSLLINTAQYLEHQLCKL